MWWQLALAGALGALARYLLDGLVQVRTDGVARVGTFVVNVTGSLAFGFVAGLFLYHGLAHRADLVVGTGFLGAYTTFSAFSYETVRLIAEGSRAAAVANAVGSVAAGLLAAAVGLGLAAAV